MTQKVSDIDSFYLTLSDNVQASVTGVRLMGSVEQKLLAIFVDGCAFDQWSFLTYFVCQTPRMQSF